MARFLTRLDRADANALKDLHDHVSQKRGPEDLLAAAVSAAPGSGIGKSQPARRFVLWLGS